MSRVKSLCVFCGASAEVAQTHRQVAADLGRAIAGKGMALVFGGGRVGLMGLLADAALDAGGTVIGVIPEHLENMEIGHSRVTELIVVDSMHARKGRMFELSDAFAILPGGFGTLDEFFEILTWRQIRLHDKPVVILDHNGYWEKLIGLMDHIIAAGFARPAARDLFRAVPTIDALFETLEAEHPPSFPSESGLL